MATDPLEKLREICLALPDTKETLTWGSPYFRVGEKIFAGYDEEDGRPSVGLKLEKPHAEGPRCRPAIHPLEVRGPTWLGHDGPLRRGGLGRGRGAHPGELPPHRPKRTLKKLS